MFKVGDRVVCINSGKIFNLKYKYTYTIIEIINFHIGQQKRNGIEIKINNGTKNYYKLSRFISLKEQRKEKLKELICSK